MPVDLFKDGGLPTVDDMVAGDQFPYIRRNFATYMGVKFGDEAQPLIEQRINYAHWERNPPWFLVFLLCGAEQAGTMDELLKTWPLGPPPRPWHDPSSEKSSE